MVIHLKIRFSYFYLGLKGVRYEQVFMGQENSKYFFIHKHDQIYVIEFLIVVVLIKYKENKYRFSNFFFNFSTTI